MPAALPESPPFSQTASKSCLSSSRSRHSLALSRSSCDVAGVHDVPRLKFRRLAHVDHERALVYEPYRVGGRHVGHAAGAQPELVEQNGRQRDEQRPDEVRMMTHELDQLTHEALGGRLLDAQV